MGARYIITVTNYLSRWAKAKLVRDCIVATAATFLLDHVVTQFGCPKISMSDQGTHFVNQLIEKITEEFQIQNSKTTPYHPQAKSFVEAFNKILENELTKICNFQRDDWDHKIPLVLWDYCTTCKILIGHNPFRLVYGQEAIMPLEYIVPSLRTNAITKIIDASTIEEILSQLV